MPILIKNLRVYLSENDSALLEKTRNKIKLPENQIRSLRIIRETLNPIRNAELFFEYTVLVTINDNEKEIAKSLKDPDVAYFQNDFADMKLQAKGSNRIKGRPVIIGTGPAGLFAGYTLALNGYNPLLIEMGSTVEERTNDIEKLKYKRILNPMSNIQFGEGGAGTFSDGKLTTRINDPRCDKVLNIFVEAGAPGHIVYSSKAHIGTDILKNVIKDLREKIVSMGGTFSFNTKVIDLKLDNKGFSNKIAGIFTSKGEYIESNAVILAIGHSSRDTYRMLFDRGVKLAQKPFAIGARIEHPQTFINEFQYGRYAGHPKLGAADYKLTAKGRTFKRNAYSFCMCPGGTVVPGTSEDGMVVTNGMSTYARNLENANSAVVVGISPDDYESSHPLSGIEFQRFWESKAFAAGGHNYNAPAQRLADFMQKKPSSQFGSIKPTYLPGVTPGNLWDCLPEYVAVTMSEALIEFNRKIKGFMMDDAVLTGVETRTSSPVRIIRDEQLCSESIEGLYPAGEGAGYAGGIMSAAVDGMKAAEEIIKKYKAP